MTEKQKRIAELKKQLLANPMKEKKVILSNNKGDKPENDPMSDKFKRVMDWGTPRLVTKNRQLAMDPKQLQSRSYLLNMAHSRKGVTDLKEDGPKQEFAQQSVSDFRKKMMEEEREDMK